MKSSCWLTRTDVYVQYHHRILKAIDTCLPVDAVHSIDEMSCKLMGREQHPANALEIARRVKRAICAHAGECLRCSVGLAMNVFLAKVATDMKKPDGLVLIPREELPQRLFGLKSYLIHVLILPLCICLT